MAYFDTSFIKTSIYEGEYVNDPSDKGGETYCGISRVNFPNWKGWSIIDTVNKSGKNNLIISGMIKVLPNYLELVKLVKDFYYANFWLPIRGDDIVSQDVANNIYDFAVNSGVNRAVRYAQRILGTKEDGILGNITLSKLNTYHDFVSVYKNNRQSFLNKIVQNNPSQVKFLAGWTKRVNNC